MMVDEQGVPVEGIDTKSELKRMGPYREPPVPIVKAKPSLPMRVLSWWLIEYLFAPFRWYRRARGGHWERWYIDHPVCAVLWLPNEHGTRPGLGMASALCEDYECEPCLGCGKYIGVPGIRMCSACCEYDRTP